MKYILCSLHECVIARYRDEGIDIGIKVKKCEECPYHEEFENDPFCSADKEDE